MAGAPTDRGNQARLAEVEIADPPAAWATAGFHVERDRVHIGSTVIRLSGRPGDGGSVGDDRGGRGLVGIRVTGLLPSSGTIDGLAIDTTTFDGGDGLAAHAADADTQARPGRGPAIGNTDSHRPRQGGDGPAADATDVDDHPDAGTGPTTEPGRDRHPNGVVGIDHLVIASPDLERTIAAFAAVGLGCRRIRETSSYGAPMRQAFFRVGSTILEVVSDDRAPGSSWQDAPSSWFGLALDVDHLEVTAARLGEGMGTIKAAVQDGRRIATLRHRTFGISLPVALMDHHGARATTGLPA